MMEVCTFAESHQYKVIEKALKVNRQGIFNNNRAKCLTLVFAFDLDTFRLAEYFKP